MSILDRRMLRGGRVEKSGRRGVAAQDRGRLTRGMWWTTSGSMEKGLFTRARGRKTMRCRFWWRIVRMQKAGLS